MCRFVATKHHVELLRMILERYNFDPTYIYSSLDPFARRDMIRRFRMEKREEPEEETKFDEDGNEIKGFSNLMIVTDIAARGIDIPLLDCVINFHFPPKELKVYHFFSIVSIEV